MLAVSPPFLIPPPPSPHSARMDKSLGGKSRENSRNLFSWLSPPLPATPKVSLSTQPGTFTLKHTHTHIMIFMYMWNSSTSIMSFYVKLQIQQVCSHSKCAEVERLRDGCVMNRKTLRMMSCMLIRCLSATDRLWQIFQISTFTYL